MRHASQDDRTKLEGTAQKVGGLIGQALEAHRVAHGGPPTCFCLMMFTQGEGGWATYVSNAEREDMIRALEEMVGKMKTGLDRN